MARRYPVPPVGCQLPSGQAEGWIAKCSPWHRQVEAAAGEWRGGAQGMGAHGAATCTSFLLSQAGRKESQRASFTSSAVSSPFKWTTDGDLGPSSPHIYWSPQESHCISPSQSSAPGP